MVAICILELTRVGHSECYLYILSHMTFSCANQRLRIYNFFFFLFFFTFEKKVESSVLNKGPPATIFHKHIT